MGGVYSPISSSPLAMPLNEIMNTVAMQNMRYTTIPQSGHADHTMTSYEPDLKKTIIASYKIDR